MRLQQTIHTGKLLGRESLIYEFPLPRCSTVCGVNTGGLVAFRATSQDFGGEQIHKMWSPELPEGCGPTRGRVSKPAS